MSIASSAKEARQSLSQGLEALQSASTPPALANVAQPLAQALRALVELEKAPAASNARGLDSALQALREGLRLLQLPDNLGHPAAERAMSSVAETLGRVLDLSRQLEADAKNADAKNKAASAPKPAAPAPVAPAPVAPALSVEREPALTARKDETPLRAVEAALGAHSATNFYKGLATGDIIASGGLFVATYQLPEVGQKLLLKVSMPGGYAFEAKGVVAWRREVSLSVTAPGAMPGFGAQISEISDEGRGLIQRYVRNREPLFHDDL
jgi:hypothetical protein